MSDLILTNRRDATFEIVLNRPDKRNAINLAMFHAFDAAVTQANRTPGLRAVVIRGAGESFSAGIDVSSLLGLAESHGPHWQQRMRSITDEFQGMLTRLERLELPTIALLHGHCLGLAFELALACDLRLAAAGPARAKELIFTGRRFDAADAEHWGIVQYVVERDALTARADELVAEISLAAPLAVGMAKRVIDGLADVDRGLMLEGWAQSQLFATEDFLEGAQAFMMRRPPQFKGR